MGNKQILTVSLLLSIVIIIVGTLLKIMHYPCFEMLLLTGFISTFVFWYIAITEIKSSTKISGGEKFMWIFGLIFISSITSLVYLLSARKRIIKNKL
ncbi:MAG: hypothetical protein RLZZ236_652 [Bacteroidota bacterium]|jgi:hypothetical protein